MGAPIGNINPYLGLRCFRMGAFYAFFLQRHLGNRTAFLQGQLVIAFCLLEIGISLLYFLAHPVFNFHVPRFIFIGLVLVNLASLFLFRTRLAIVAIAHLVIAVLFFSFCLGIGYSGGIFSPVVAWLAVMPVMANLLIHQRAAILWATVALLATGVFFFQFNQPTLILDARGDWRALFSSVGLIVIILGFTYLFHESRQALLVKLGQKNKKLEQRKNRLIDQNAEILAQKSFIDRQYHVLQEQKRSIEQFNRLLSDRVQEITHQNKRLEKHWQALLNISRSQSVHAGAFHEAVQEIVHTATTSLSIDRVSVWRYNAHQHTIRCLYLFDARDGSTQDVEVLVLDEFPGYFQALLREDVIPADQAQANPQTFELKQAYLVPRSIVSMLDTPFFLDGMLGGVLCCEHSRERHWGHEDILFVQALADIVSLAFRAQERRVYEARLLEKQEEITRTNQTLEERVRLRTLELERQNAQLSEYAYINSHLLRAPLSRLLGLVNLLRYAQIVDHEKELIINHIKTAGDELDEIVAKINAALHVTSTVTREQVR